MSDLRPEYQKIVDAVINDLSNPALDYGDSLNLGTYDPEVRAFITDIVNRCQELANKPVKQLTDKQITDAWASGGTSAIKGLRAVIDAHIRLQRNPEEVTFNYELWKTGEWIAFYTPVNGNTHVAEFIKPNMPGTYTMALKS